MLQKPERVSPRLSGRPISVRLLAALTVQRGVLISGSGEGRAVHAASYIRRREIVLDDSLKKQPVELARILVHELCHFTWVRLANAARREWERLLEAEIRAGYRGDLGWSAEMRKVALRPADRRSRTRRWREYACESFCDTGAWLFSGAKRHPEFTLPSRCRRIRRRWFVQHGLFEDMPV